MNVTQYEGRCEVCHRDIGTGHLRWCPYWHPRRQRIRASRDK